MSSTPSLSQEKLVLSSRSPSTHVAILTLNRPKAKNALSSPLFEELNAELEKADQDDGVRAIVITGGEKVFAAGADIKEMKDKTCEWGFLYTAHEIDISLVQQLMRTVAEAYRKNFLGSWGKLASIQKPIIGAVAGFAVSTNAIPTVCYISSYQSDDIHSNPRHDYPHGEMLIWQLGGGCELALMTDILISTPTAQFGQPEITLGIIPGGGGTQRLAKVIGKAKTMDLVLTNRWISGEQAEQWGLVSRITKEGESVVDEAVKIGDQIAGYGAVATQAGKEAVNAGKFSLPPHQWKVTEYMLIESTALELPLQEGLRFERRLFHSLFSTADQKEGE